MNLPHPFEVISTYISSYHAIIDMYEDTNLTIDMKFAILTHDRVGHAFCEQIKTLGGIHHLFDPDTDDGYSNEENLNNFITAMKECHEIFYDAYHHQMSLCAKLFGHSIAIDESQIKDSGFHEIPDKLKEIVRIYDDETLSDEDKENQILMDSENFEDLLYSLTNYGIEFNDGDCTDLLKEYVDFIRKLIDIFNVVDYHYTRCISFCEYQEEMQLNHIKSQYLLKSC